MNELIITPADEVLAFETKLSEKEDQSLKSKFLPVLEGFDKLKTEAQRIKNLPIETAAQEARTHRIKAKNVRCRLEEKRKKEKEDSLKIGRAIDGLANYWKGHCEEIESDMLAIECYHIQKEKERKEKIYQTRIETLSQYVSNTNVYNVADISDEDFNILVSEIKAANEQKAAAKKKAEQARKEAEEMAKIERERIEKENAKLRAEAAAAEKERAAIQVLEEKKEKERLEAQAIEDEKNRLKLQKEAEKAEKERKEKEALQEQIREKERLEAEKIEAQKKADKQARLAPDKDKLIALANRISSIDMPAVKSDEAKKVIERTLELIGKLTIDIKSQANKM